MGCGNHVKSKHQGITYECEHCQLTFKSKDGLRDHIKIKHTLDCNEYKCEECEYVTRGRGANLERHIAAIHRKEKFLCDQCSFKTTVKSELKKHVCRLSCRKRDFKANWKKERKLHYRNDHTMEEQSELLQHPILSKQQGKLSCSQCSYRTNFGGNLRLHISEKHEDIQRFCQICEYQTKSLSSLKFHMKSKH